MRQFYQILNKRTWKDYLKIHFEKLKKDDDKRVQSLSKNKRITCFDFRCPSSFDTIQDFQFHYQDIHCIDRTKLIKEKQIKKRRCTLRFKAGTKCESHYDYCFINQTWPSKRADKVINAVSLEPARLVCSMELMTSIESKKQSESVRNSVDFLCSKDPKSFDTNENSFDTALNIATSRSFVIFDRFIDLRFLNNWFRQPFFRNNMCDLETIISKIKSRVFFEVFVDVRSVIVICYDDQRSENSVQST